MSYYVNKTISGNFDEVITDVTSRLALLGFGILTTIDVKKTLHEKIGFDFKPYTILGACNPLFASKALTLEEKLGVLLPCNVVVIDQGGGRIEVAAMEPLAVMESINNPELTELIEEISCKIKRLIKEL